MMMKVTSLSFLALAACWKAKAVQGDCDPEIITKEVIIIGAGVAGLTAAKTLLEDQNPLDFLILESQDNRVGGRVRSNSDWFPGVTVEEGANWFSDNTLNPALTLARGYGVELYNQDFESFNLYGYDVDGFEVLDGKFSDIDIFKANNCIQNKANKLYLPNGENSIDFNRTGGLQQVLSEQCGWDEDSSLDFFYDWFQYSYEFAEKDTSMYSFPTRRYDISKFFFVMDQNGGFEKYPKSYAHEFLSLSCTADDGCEDNDYFMFNQIVEKIYYNVEEGEYPVKIETNFNEDCPSHRFLAKRAISTLPQGVVNSGSVEFIPPLPNPSPFKMADFVKVFYQFTEKFWEDTDDNEFIVSIPKDYEEIQATNGRCMHWQSLDYTTGRKKGPKQTSPEIVPESRILFCSLTTEAFQQLLFEAGGNELTEDQLLGSMLMPLKEVFGDNIADLVQLEDVQYPRFYNDPNFLGSYENWQPGFDLEDYYRFHGGALVEPCAHNGCTEPGGDWTLHLSGSSSCLAQWGLVRGALDAGIRSANLVRADIGCGGAGCTNVDTTSECDADAISANDQVPAPDCGDYTKRGKCKQNGCAWSQASKTCSSPAANEDAISTNDQVPAPDCGDYTKKSKCKKNGCAWSKASKTCGS